MSPKKASIKATIRDIANKLNITPSTVSRALNGHQAISESTRRQVVKTAQKLNYRHNKIASSLRLGKTNIIGVIIPSAEIHFFGSIVHGIERIASQHDYNVIIYQSNERFDFEKKGIETLLRTRVDAVLASIAKETTSFEHFIEVKKRGIPLILFDRVNYSLNLPAVVIDDYLGAYHATLHLIQQGCRRIAHIGGPQHVFIFKERKRGYVDALKSKNLCPEKNLVVLGSISIESGRRCMQKLLAGEDRPDGVFAVEDFTALGAMQALKEHGIAIPDEIALIGFANEPFGKYVTPSLSTVDQQTTKMGEEATKLFFELSLQKGTARNPPPKIVLEPKIIARESSMKKNPV